MNPLQLLVLGCALNAAATLHNPESSDSLKRASEPVLPVRQPAKHRRIQKLEIMGLHRR